MIPVQNTVLASTFDFWRNRTNEMALYFSTCAVTTDANGSTTAATGNAEILGSFTAANLHASNGTVNAAVYVVSNSSVNNAFVKLSNSSVNTYISIPTIAQYYSSYVLAANGAWAFNPVSNGSVSHSGNNLFNIDNFLMSDYNNVEYNLSVKDNYANNYYACKVLTTHDTSTAFITEYASLITNTSLGTFTADANNTHVRLWFTSSKDTTQANVTVKYTRIVT